MPEEPRKRQVLFVDDELLVLQGLQRMLRGMRNEWDMCFVDGGPEALALMAERSFDVVVSDMRMPGMTGAEFLNAVAARHPATIRFILSGHADQDLIKQCLGSAHQYLTKPCNPDLLKQLLNDTCRADGDVLSCPMKETVGRMDRLPSLPDNLTSLMGVLDSEDCSHERLQSIISRDLGMTAKVLKLVNSAFFGLRRELADIGEAIPFLGLETLRALIRGQRIFEEAAPLQTRRIRLEDIFSHSLAVAKGARAILRVLGAGEREQGEARTLGLLQDAGTLILASRFPEGFDQALDLVADEGYPPALAEQRAFGFNRWDVGAYLVGLWGLPPVLVQGIKHLRRPSALPGQTEGPTPLAAVHLAEAFLSRTSNHPAYVTTPLDEVLAKQPWIADGMEVLERTCRA